MNSKPITILVIDDDEFIQTLLNETLTADGYNVLLAGSAAETYRILEETLPDLFVMDIILPDQNGFELCKDLRSREATARVPILMLSSKYTVSDRVKGLNLGADDYLVKPFHLEELSARVKALHRRMSPAVTQVKSVAMPEKPPIIPPDADLLIEEPEEEPEVFIEPVRVQKPSPKPPEVSEKTKMVSAPPVKADDNSFDGRRARALEYFKSNQLEESYHTYIELNKEQPKNLEVKKYIEITRNQLMKKYFMELGSKDSVPIRTSDRPGEFIGLDFNTEEGFIFSRIDGVTDCKGIVAISGMGTIKAYGILYHFSQSGVIKIKGK